jgi:hypothetical protein
MALSSFMNFSKLASFSRIICSPLGGVYITSPWVLLNAVPGVFRIEALFRLMH